MSGTQIAINVYVTPDSAEVAKGYAAIQAEGPQPPDNGAASRTTREAIPAPPATEEVQSLAGAEGEPPPPGEPGAETAASLAGATAPMPPDVSGLAAQAQGVSMAPPAPPELDEGASQTAPDVSSAPVPPDDLPG